MNSAIPAAQDADIRGPRLWSRTEAIVVVAVFVTSVAAGAIAVNGFTSRGGRPQYYQVQFGPAVLLACGHGFVNPPSGGSRPGDVPYLQPNNQVPEFRALGAFLAQERNTLDCSDLPVSFKTEAPRLFQSAHRYLMLLAAAVWMVTGVSWSALNMLAALLFGATGALVYLLARAGMGRIFALAITAIFITSPMQLVELPHLRDYAKAPFFMFTLCAVAWIALTRASRRWTIAALAIMGGVLGFGFGVRTDVMSYLPFVVLAVLVFRPGFDRGDVITRGFAATAAVASFMVVASPILRAYQSADNLAHVAILGLSDPSRDWLRLSAAPYSFGRLYHDGYVETMFAGYAERIETRTTPLAIGTPDYARFGDEYYRRVIETFPADLLVRSWAAVISVLQRPFGQPQRPAWIDASWEPVFRFRAAALSALDRLPPLVAATLLVVGTGVVSTRLGGLLVLFGIIVPGMTSLQFQGRHVFHLEILSLFAYGCLLHFVWQRLKKMQLPQPAVIRATALKALLVALGLAAFVVVPVTAARRYQDGTVTKLLSSYESADLVRIDASEQPVGNERVLLPTPFDPSEQPSHYMDTNVLSITASGEHCDVDEVQLTLRYRAAVPYADFTSQTALPVFSSGGVTRLVLPVYTLGTRAANPQSMQFVGIELPAAERTCIQSIDRFKNPERFPLLLESLLLPEWRQRPLHEALRDLEPSPDGWRTASYSIPDGLQPGRRWLARLAVERASTTFRSPQVQRLDEHGIEIRGRAETPDSYLLAWADEFREQGSVFVVEGVLAEGGLSVGIQRNGQWVQLVNVLRPGRFRTAIRMEEAGHYGAVLSNNQQDGLQSHIDISRYGWLPPEE